MRRGWRRLRAEFGKHPLLGVLGLLLPLAVVLGSSVLVEILDQELGIDWQWYDDHQAAIQLALAGVVLLLGLTLLKPARTRPVGVGVLMGLVVVGIIAVLVLLCWVGVVLIWVIGCATNEC